MAKITCLPIPGGFVDVPVGPYKVAYTMTVVGDGKISWDSPSLVSCVNPNHVAEKVPQIWADGTMMGLVVGVMLATLYHKIRSRRRGQLRVLEFE